MSDLLPEHVEWCRRQVNMIRVGGVWGIPRSGLIFTRTGEDELTLTQRMPWIDGMPITPDQLADQQQDEYDETARHMRAAGITMIDATVTHS
jgi:hypothetical protein